MKQYAFLPRLLSLLAVIAAAACSSTTTTPAPAGPAVCDPTQCIEKGGFKNECIADANGVAACRIACTDQTTNPGTGCPFNTYCATSSPQNYCVKLSVEIQKKPVGQWGSPCLPTGGLDNNPACDAETGFACYGAGTTDATAYCTRYDCETDLDCAGGFHCATINNAPNVKTDVRSFGKTRTVCLKRDYCAPCASDIDCPVIDGKPSRCTDDDVGGKFCATACATSSNCRLDATCTGVAEDGTKVCRPRAGVCTGDGSICSPCRSDANCPMGFCIKAAYSPERFCSVKSAIACKPGSGTATIVKGDCPAFAGFAGTQIGCQSAGDESIPKDQCIGLISFGDTGDIACYTKH